MRRKVFLLMTLSVLTLCLATTGCEDNDGPMENMGEDIDETIDDVGDEIEDGTDN